MQENQPQKIDPMPIFKNIVEFMGRTQLQGREVPAFNECMNLLHSIINPTPPPAQPEQPAVAPPVAAPLDPGQR